MPLFHKNPTLGWELRPGEFSIYINDSSTKTTITIDENKRRITKYYVPKNITKSPKIHIYGCSFTFGYSVADSLTQASILQKLMPDSKIENMGVPAYGLSQMYLYLKENTLNGEKPNIAVFNFSNFHEQRTPLHKIWSSLLWKATTHGDSKIYNELTYPYFIIEDGVLRQKNIKFNQLSKYWIMSEKSSFIRRLNYLYYNKADNSIENKLKDISILTAIEIMTFCKSNNIIPIFAFILNKDYVKPDYEILDVLRSQNHHVLEYGLDIGDSGYNNCPYDCGHPNAAANKVYAEKLFMYIHSNNFIK